MVLLWARFLRDWQLHYNEINNHSLLVINLVEALLFLFWQRSHPGSADEADNITDEEFEGKYYIIVKSDWVLMLLSKKKENQTVLFGNAH